MKPKLVKMECTGSKKHKCFIVKESSYFLIDKGTTFSYI